MIFSMDLLLNVDTVTNLAGDLCYRINHLFSFLTAQTRRKKRYSLTFSNFHPDKKECSNVSCTFECWFLAIICPWCLLIFTQLQKFFFAEVNICLTRFSRLLSYTFGKVFSFCHLTELVRGCRDEPNCHTRLDTVESITTVVTISCELKHKQWHHTQK